MNKNRKLINAFLVSTMMLSGLALDVSAADMSVKRLDGDTRIETAVEVSKEVYAAGSAKNVVLVGRNGEVDALTGTLLAASMDAPVLLVSQYSDVKAELTRLGAENVYILGSTGVVSDALKAELDADFTVERIAGADRIETAVAVAKKAGAAHNHVFLTNDGRGNGELADALSAGPASGSKQLPILLTAQGNLSAKTKAAITDFGVKEVTIVGGYKAVDKAVEAELTAAGVTKINRLAGEDRAETAVKVAEAHFADSKKVVIANDGRFSYADALLGGYLGAKENAPVLLTGAGSLDEVTKNFLGNKAMFAYVLGGNKAIAPATEAAVKTIVDKNNIVEDFKVASVEAISATQMLVEFTQEVDKATAEESANYTLNGLDDQVETKAKKAELQEDKKSVVVTVDKALAKRYQVKIQNVQLATDKEDVVDYDEVLTFAADTTAPTAKAERMSINTFKIKFSEPVKSGSIKAQYKDGTAVEGITFTPANLELPADGMGHTEVVVVLGTDVVVDKEVVVTLNGVQDMVGNLITPQPTKLTITKQAADKILPAIETVSQTGAKKFALKFNKDLDGSLAKEDVTIVGYTTEEMKKISASEYEFTMDKNLKGLVTVVVEEGKAVDTDGQMNKKALEKIVTFKKDEAKPKATTELVVGKDNKEYLELTFDKDVTEGTITLKGSHIKDYITTSVDTTVAAVYADEKEEDKTVLRVPLLADLLKVEGAVYDLTITSSDIKSDSDEIMDSAKAKFTRGKDGDADVTINAVLTKEDIKVTQPSDNNNKVLVTFTLGEDQKLDGATATNLANYSIAGAEIESVSLAAASGNQQVVTLTLKDESNTFTGVRNIIVKGIKILGSSKVMEPVTINDTSLTENVKPELTKAQITKAGEAPEITLTFTETVKATANSEENFTVLVGGKELTGEKKVLTATISAGGDDNTLVLTMNRLLTAEELEEGIELKINKAEQVNITDMAGNEMSTTGTIKVVLD